jgi:hypothetical protein
MPVDRERRRLAAQVLDYEWQMLHFCASKLDGLTSVHPLEKNLYIEGFLIHYRTIVEFLQPRPTTKNHQDLTATDLADGFTATRAPVEYLDPIDKHLAHLSYARRSKRGWPHRRMLEKLQAAWSELEDAMANPTAP